MIPCATVRSVHRSLGYRTVRIVLLGSGIQFQWTPISLSHFLCVHVPSPLLRLLLFIYQLNVPISYYLTGYLHTTTPSPTGNPLYSLRKPLLTRAICILSLSTEPIHTWPLYVLRAYCLQLSTQSYSTVTRHRASPESAL